jgi:hypothetical protein
LDFGARICDYVGWGFPGVRVGLFGEGIHAVWQDSAGGGLFGADGGGGGGVWDTPYEYYVDWRDGGLGDGGELGFEHGAE